MQLLKNISTFIAVVLQPSNYILDYVKNYLLFVDLILSCIGTYLLYIYFSYLGFMAPLALQQTGEMYISQCFQPRKELSKFLLNIHILKAKKTLNLTTFPQPEVNMAICYEGSMNYMGNSGYQVLPNAIVNIQYNDRGKYRIDAGTSLIIVNFRIGALRAFFDLPSDKREPYGYI